MEQSRDINNSIKMNYEQQILQVYNNEGAYEPPPPPDYSLLSSTPIFTILDSTGLEHNINNLYGTVNSSGQVTAWKSLAPGPTGRDFAANGNAASLRLGLYGEILFDGSARFRHNSANTWNHMSYNATIGNLKWTVHCVVRCGFKNNNHVYGIFGNNARSAGNIGNSLFTDERVLVPINKSVNANLSKGSAGFIISSSVPDIPDLEEWHVITIETDMSLPASSRQRVLVDGIVTALTVSSPSTAVITTPTFDMEIGGCGNGSVPLFGAMTHWIELSGISDQSVRDAFIQTLLPHTNRPLGSLSTVDQSRTYSVYNTYAPSGRYFFLSGICQSINNVDVLGHMYHNGDEHVESDDKRLEFRKSTDKGRTFGTPILVFDYDTSGSYGVQSSECGVSSDGRFYGLSDWHTTIGTNGGLHKLFMHVSQNEGDLWVTTDITSQIPANGLASYRAHGKIVEMSGFMYATLFMREDEANNTTTAVYVMRKPVGSSTTWEFFLVDSTLSASVFLNEAYLEVLDDDGLICQVRNETTKEFSQYIGTSQGTVWSAREAAAFGENYTVGTPPLLSSFEIEGTKIIAAWIADRTPDAQNLKVVYGKASDLKANGAAGWNLTTKTTVYSGTRTLHYGGICHYHNNMNAIGTFALEKLPFDELENTMVTFHCTTTQYLAVKSALGL